MNITWLAPLAFAGLALMALPIAIHLLVRQQTRTLLYPSLRFLRETALAAFRRRRIEDAILLICRVAIVAIAALALAGPVVQSSSRTATYAGRVASAHVSVGASGEPPRSAVAADAFRSASFSRVEIADAIRDALRWLADQPPASREIVFSGTLARGSIDAADLLVIPRDVGIRFVPREHQAPTDGTIRALVIRNGALTLVRRRVQLDADATRVADEGGDPAPADRIRVIARPEQQPLADAALQTLLEQGVLWTAEDRQVVIDWDEADAPTPDAIRRRVEALMPAGLDEPILIAEPQLQAWSRPSGPPSPSAPVADEGDRRWLWALALGLLAVEQWRRRSVDGQAVSQQETRVA